MATEVVVDVPGEERVVESKSMEKTQFPGNRVSWPTAECACWVSQGHFCKRPRKIERKKRKSIYGCQSECFFFCFFVCLLLFETRFLWTLVVFILKKWKKDIPWLTVTTLLWWMEPQRAWRIWKLFSLSKDDILQYVVWKSLNKKGMEYKTKTPMIHHLVTPHVLKLKSNVLLWRKNALRKKRRGYKIC